MEDVVLEEIGDQRFIFGIPPVVLLKSFIVGGDELAE